MQTADDLRTGRPKLEKGDLPSKQALFPLSAVSGAKIMGSHHSQSRSLDTKRPVEVEENAII
jgi:hypothetical protein